MEDALSMKRNSVNCVRIPLIQNQLQNIYTIKDLVIMETSIVDSNKKFYILAMKKLALHFPRIHIVGTHHCGKTHQESFKYCAAYHNVLLHKYYSECVVASFAHQIQYEYCGDNIFMSIEGITL